MTLGFERRTKVAPGVRANLGKRGVSSVSLVPRGASISVGHSGTYLNASAPWDRALDAKPPDGKPLF
jgi:hypothetical protein